jgi:hypothetical protein
MAVAMHIPYDELRRIAVWRRSSSLLGEGRMSPRTRKLIGSLALVFLIGSWAVAATVVAMGFVSASRTVQMIFYLVAGLIWVVPAGAIIAWMQRPPRARA